MDVTFRELVPFYGEKTDLSFMFESDSTSIDESSREGENGDVNDSNEQPLRKMDAVISSSVPKLKEAEPQADKTWQHKNISKVYTRKKFGSQAQAREVVPVSTTEQCSASSVPHEEPEIIDVTSTSETEIEASSPADLPIALRKDV